MSETENAAVTENRVEDTSVPVEYPRKPGGVFPNHYAFMFLYAPAFAFAKIPGAVKYRYETTDAAGKKAAFCDTSPDKPLSPLWNALPTGIVTLTVTGEDASGTPVGLAGSRTFFKKAPFTPGHYETKRRSYRETAELILQNRFNSPEIRDLLAGKSPAYNFPTKQLAAAIGAAKRRGALCPETSEESRRVVTCAADLLLSLSAPAGAPLAGFTPTYYADDPNDSQRGKTMLIYPASGVCAFLDAYEITGDKKYLTAGTLGADTFLKLQEADGTWPLIVAETDGRAIGNNRCMPLIHMEMFLRLYRITGKEAYLKAADRAFGFLERRPLSDWNWEGQFEDTPATEPYKNLTKHDACSAAIYLTERYPGDRQRIATARQLLRFAEDLFVNWEKPFADGRLLYPEKDFGYYNHYWDIEDWIMPSVFEQYGCFTPVDASAAKLIRTYLALYRAEGKALDLEKALVLGDAITRMTDDDGLESTWWDRKQLRQDIWPNCMLACEAALEELLPYEKN